jgi:hypothetical protein
MVKFLNMKQGDGSQPPKEVLTTFVGLIGTGYAELCLAVSAKYLEALKGWSALASPATSVTIIKQCM